MEAQILDTAFSPGVEKCRSKTFSILSTLGFALRCTPLFHHHFIIHPVLFILCFISMKSVTSLIIPVAFMIVRPLNHWLFYVWPMLVRYELFIPVVVDESDDPFYIIYFMLAWLGYHVSYIDIHLIICYMCKLDMAMHCVNYWVFTSYDIFILFRYYFMLVKLQFREYLYGKSYRKSKQVSAYGLLGFYWEMSKKFDAGNRCRQCINNVIKLCYYLSGSFSLLSGFNCFWTAIHWMIVLHE